MERRNFVNGAMATIAGLAGAGLVGAKTIPERLAEGEQIAMSVPVDPVTMLPQVTEQALGEVLGCKVTDVKVGTAANGMPEERLTLEFTVETPKVVEPPIEQLLDQAYPAKETPCNTYDVEVVEIPEYVLSFFYDRYTGELMVRRGWGATLGEAAAKVLGTGLQMWKYVRPKLVSLGLSRITADEIERRAKDMLVMRGVRMPATCPDSRFTADGIREEIELFQMRFGNRPTHMEITPENLNQLLRWVDAPYGDSELLNAPRSSLRLYGLRVQIVHSLSPSHHPYLLLHHVESGCYGDVRGIAKADFR